MPEEVVRTTLLTSCSMFKSTLPELLTLGRTDKMMPVSLSSTELITGALGAALIAGEEINGRPLSMKGTLVFFAFSAPGGKCHFRAQSPFYHASKTTAMAKRVSKK